MKRRNFIQRLAGTGIVLPVMFGFPRTRAFARSPQSFLSKVSSAGNDHVMVLIRMAGGNDGLNTVVPYTSNDYYAVRGTGTDGMSIAPEEVVKISDSSTVGFHPGFASLKDIYEEGKMAVVQNVGYNLQNLSHFRSTDIWLSGSDWDTYDDAGWYAKYLEAKYPDYPDVLPQHPFAIELGTYLSTTLIGNRQNMGIAVASLDHIPGLPGTDPVAQTNAGIEEAYVREIARQSNIFSNAIKDAAEQVLQNKVTYPNTPLGQGLAAISRLIAAGLSTQLYIVNMGGFDTHSNQKDVQAGLLAMLADAVAAFQRDLEAFGTDGRTSLMTISEFGRRVEHNGTGTDHGSAAPMFFFGSGVNGGIYGHDADLGDLEGPGNLKLQYDFRQLYASVLSQWFQAEDEEIYPAALPAEFEQLPIFKSIPSSVAYNNGVAAGFQVGQSFPNPAVGRVTIPVQGIVGGMDARLEVYTLNGRQVLSRTLSPGEQKVEIDVSGLPAGSYVYELAAGNLRRTRTMTVVR